MTCDPKKFDGFDRPDETPKTFAELKPPGYWSKSAGCFVPVCKDEREFPSGKITVMKAPTQCALWAKPELLGEPNRRDRFERLETFVDKSHEFRDLLKCKECGQLYFAEFYEEIDWEDGDDPQYWTYVPVETGGEIEMLKRASRGGMSGLSFHVQPGHEQAGAAVVSFQCPLHRVRKASRPSWAFSFLRSDRQLTPVRHSRRFPRAT